MTVRKLYIYPDPPLKQKITNSDVTIENVKDEVKDLIDTLKHYEGNFYITSNNIGLSKRIAVIDLQAVYKKEFPETDRFLVMVNPEIVEFSNEIVELQEGSISTPDFITLNKKSRSVKVKFDKVVLKLQEQLESNVVVEEPKTDDVTVINNKLDFEKFDFQTDVITIWEGLAYVVQAAVSQLDGKCYLDNVSWYNRERYLKKRRKTVKQFQNWVKSSLMGINTAAQKKKYKFAK
jgi:peptide deformylase